MAAPIYVQNAFRGRNDNGSLSTATYFADLNANFTTEINHVFRLRQVVQNTAANADTGNQTYELWCSRNEGAYFQVTSASSYVQLTNDANSIADNAATVKSIGTGTYTANTSNGYNDGTTDDITGIISITRGTEAEVEHCLQILDTSSAGDTFDFRLRRSTATVLNTYNYTPRITAYVAVIHEGRTTFANTYSLFLDLQKEVAGFVDFDLGINLLSNGTKNINCATEIINHLLLNSVGSEDVDAKLTLSNNYSLASNGSLNIFGNIKNNIEFDLKSNGNIFGEQQGSCSLSSILSLSSSANIDHNVSVLLSNVYSVLSDGSIVSTVVTSNRFISNKKLLLLLNALESSNQSIVKRFYPIVGDLLLGRALLQQNSLLISNCGLTTKNYTDINIDSELFAKGSRDFVSKTNTSVIFNNSNFGSLNFNERGILNINLNTYSKGAQDYNEYFTLTSILTFLSVGNLTIEDRAVLNKYYNLFANDSRSFTGITTANIDINTENVGNLQFNGEKRFDVNINLDSVGNRNIYNRTQLNNNYTMFSVPNLNIAGSNINNIIIHLDSNADIAGQQFGESALSTIINLLISGKIDIEAKSEFNNIYNLSLLGHREFAGKTNYRIDFDYDAKDSRDFSGSFDLNNVFGLGLVGSRNFYSRINLDTYFNSLFNGNRNIHNSFDISNVFDLVLRGSRDIFNQTSLASNIDLLSLGTRTLHNGANLNNNYTLLSIPNINISGSNVSNMVLILDSEGSIAGQSFGESALSTIINLIVSGKLDISGKSYFDNSYSLNSFGSRDIVGNNINSILFSLLSSGSTEAEQLGYVNVATIISLLSNAILEQSGQTVLNHIYNLSNTGSKNINGKVDLNHLYQFYPFGTINISGKTGQTLVLDLTSFGSRLFSGQVELDAETLLSTVGTRQFNANTNLNNIYGLNLRGLRDVGAFSNLNNEYVLRGTLGGEIQGRVLSEIIFDLAALLSTDSDSIKNLLFNLNIVQNKHFNLNLLQNKQFDLKIKQNKVSLLK